MAGLEVTPRSESSSTSRCSSPDSIMPRRIWSSQTLTPASVSAARRSFTPAAIAMSAPRSRSVHRLARLLGDALGRDPEVLVHLRRGAGLAERRHPDEAALGPDPAVPPERAGRLDRDARPHRRREDG